MPPTIRPYFYFFATCITAAIAFAIYKWSYFHMPNSLWQEETKTVHVQVNRIDLKPVRGGYHKVAHFEYPFNDSTYAGIYIFHRLDEQCSTGDSLSITFEKAQPTHYTVRGVVYEKPYKGVNIDSLSTRYNSREY